MEALSQLSYRPRYHDATQSWGCVEAERLGQFLRRCNSAGSLAFSRPLALQRRNPNGAQQTRAQADRVCTRAPIAWRSEESARESSPLEGNLNKIDFDGAELAAGLLSSGRTKWFAAMSSASGVVD